MTSTDREIREGEVYVRRRVPLPSGGGELVVLQPAEAAELPDDGPVEWAPLLPYWSVLWRSGVALARSLAADAPRLALAGARVVELGCGLALPSLVAARAGASVLATDGDPDALPLVERNAAENGVAVETACVDWAACDTLADRGPFDLVLAADVLYERASVGLLLSLLPRLGGEVLLADPGRPAAEAFLEGARRSWSVASSSLDGVRVHRLTALAASPS